MVDLDLLVTLVVEFREEFVILGGCSFVSADLLLMFCIVLLILFNYSQRHNGTIIYINLLKPSKRLLIC